MGLLDWITVLEVRGGFRRVSEKPLS
jgi:hypothetical protein